MEPKVTRILQLTAEEMRVAKGRSPRVLPVCEKCGEPAKPLVHVEADDFHGWVCGPCFSDRWPGLLLDVVAR